MKSLEQAMSADDRSGARILEIENLDSEEINTAEKATKAEQLAMEDHVEVGLDSGEAQPF